MAVTEVQDEQKKARQNSKCPLNLDYGLVEIIFNCFLQVNPTFIVREHLIKKERGLFSSSIGLLMTLRDEHFRDGELRVKCRGTIAAEFWKRDVENVYNTEKDSFVKVLEVKESQWPDAASSNQVNFLLILVIMLPLLTDF